MIKGSGGNDLGHNFYDIMLNGVDDTVTPGIVAFGTMGKDAGGTWHWTLVSADGAPLVRSDDASKFRVSALGVTVTTSPLSADSSSISAKQGDASNLQVSGKSGDAGLFRVSAIGGTAGDRTLVDGTTQTISATLTPVSASPAGSVAGLVTNDQSYDAGKMHVSALNQDANFMHVSGFSPDAGLFRISAIGADANSLHVSAVQGDAGLFHVSVVGTLTVSAHEVKQSDAAALRISAIGGDANTLHTSAVQGSADQLRVSAILAAGVSSVGAASFGVSAAQSDAGALHTSAYSGDANQHHVSAIQNDATVLRVSADLYPDTVGGLTIFRSKSVSASQNVKSTAGAIYGYYAWNTDTKFEYINLYNVSGAVNIGTDTPIWTIALPASAAAHVEYPHGLAGFTAGIGIAAVSAVADNATTQAPASAVGINLFYK